MAETGSRTAVVVAMIGLIGTIAAAIIVNMGKSVPQSQTNSTPTSPTTRSPATSGASPPIQPTSQSGPSSVRVVSVSPPSSTALTDGSGNLTIEIRYQVSTENGAILMVGNAMYAGNGSGCTGYAADWIRAAHSNRTRDGHTKGFASQCDEQVHV